MTSQTTSARVSFNVSLEELNEQRKLAQLKPLTQKEFFDTIGGLANISFKGSFTDLYDVKLTYITK